MIKRTTTLSKWLLSLLLAICMASDVSAQTNIVVPTGGTAGNTNGSGADPVCDYFNFIRYQVVYTVAELSAAGLASGNTITGIGWNITEDPGYWPIIQYEWLIQLQPILQHMMHQRSLL